MQCSSAKSCDGSVDDVKVRGSKVRRPARRWHFHRVDVDEENQKSGSDLGRSRLGRQRDAQHEGKAKQISTSSTEIEVEIDGAEGW